MQLVDEHKSNSEKVARQKKQMVLRRMLYKRQAVKSMIDDEKVSKLNDKVVQL